MRKVFWILGCIILAAGLYAMDCWQGYHQEMASQQLKQDNAEIQKLINEKAQLENEKGQAQQEPASQTSETTRAVLCFLSPNEAFYTEIYPIVSNTVDTGILVLENGKLPGDTDYISTQDFSTLMDRGWTCAVSLERDADNAQWQTNIENYLTALSNRVSTTPTVYYLTSGNCSETDAQMLKTLGFETVLCHGQQTAKTVGDINIVELFGYNDSNVQTSVSESESNCALEIRVSWDSSDPARVRYTETALHNLLDNTTIAFQGLDDMIHGQTVTQTQNADERISEINEQIASIYH